MITRRRVFSIFAGLAVTSARAAPAASWRGEAMGAEARIVLAEAPAGSVSAVFRGVERIIAQVEQAFSLHADSELARLNAAGLLRNPSRAMLHVVALSGRAYRATGGAFDPTVQPLWLALARGHDPVDARQLVGWEKVQATADGIRLSPGCQLTFNGIAQGYCADQVAMYLRERGFSRVLVDAGELSALGQPAADGGWPVTIVGPDGGVLQSIGLNDRALATSSPSALRLAKGEPHIVGPGGQSPRWSTVSVSATSAAVADALSTAACLMDRGAIGRAVGHFPGARIEAIA